MSEKNKTNNYQEKVRQETTKRSVGIQSIVAFKDQINPKIAASFILEEEEYPKFVTIPHTLSSMILTMCFIYYIAFKTPFDGENVFSILSSKLSVEEERNMMNTYFFYLKCLFVVILSLGVSYFPDSIMRRPHPVFWRIVYSTALFYFIVLLFFCTLTRDDAHYMLKIFDEKLNKPLEYKSYGDNCSLQTNEFPYFTIKPILDNLDVYVVAHLVGWFVKYIAIRNFWFAMFLSLLFEIFELTFQHWLPNFIECWWDHALLDYFGMNLLGIIAGYYLVEYFNMKSYKWMNTQNKSFTNQTKQINHNNNLTVECNNVSDSSKNSNNYSSDLMRNKSIMKYFTPTEVTIYKWDVLSSSFSFFSVLWFIATVNLVDLSHFFLKTIMWLPITHAILSFRIFLWGFLCIMATREFYEYTTNRNCKKLGHFVWLSQVILCTEWMIIIKFSSGMFTEEFPTHIVYCWSAAIIVLIVIAFKIIIKDLIKYFTGYRNTKTKDRNSIDIEYHN